MGLTRLKVRPLIEDEEKKKEETEDIVKNESLSTGVFQLFRFADVYDKILMFFGSLCSIGTGFGLPLAILAFGDTMGVVINEGRIHDLLESNKEFLEFVNLTRTDVMKHPREFKELCPDLDEFRQKVNVCSDIEFGDPLTDKVGDYVIRFTVIGTAVLLSGFGQVTCWSIAGARQIRRIRFVLFKNILRQDIGWFDMADPGELNSRLTNDLDKLQRGIGETVTSVIQYFTTFVVGCTVGFFRGAQLAAVLVASSPLLIIAGATYSYFAVALTAREQKAYAKAGAIAQEVLSSVRTVVAFGGEEKEVQRYDRNLGDAQRYGQNKGMAHGVSIGMFQLANFATYALGFWYGDKLMTDEAYEANDILITFFAISISTFSLGSAAPGIQNMTEARAAAYSVFKLIDMEPRIDSSSTSGMRPEYFQGNIKFKNVHFTYPSRPQTKILNGLNLEVRPGQTVALVGSSGCGKSTVVQLLLRFYDAQEGQVIVDGMDVKDLNVKWLRQHIGLVSQEPILFDTTIAENIRYGCDDVSSQDIIDAAKKANAYDFICKLPDKFHTMVGERGAQLSGGQKQRIAIARALISDPKILLLDEATSALDTESESIVQDALDKARQGRTTLVIAHRLSTIRTADIIVGIDNGTVKEEGTHKELMEFKGIYHTLVVNQTKGEQEKNAVISNGYGIDKMSKTTATDGAGDRYRALSLNSVGDETEETEEIDKATNASLLRVLKMNAKEWYFLLFGCLCSLVFGTCQPIFAVIYSEFLNAFQLEEDERKDEVRKYCLILLGIGAISLATAIGQSWMFSIAGEALTRRLRRDSFTAMLKQEMSWFDRPQNNTGALTYKLNIDASKVQEASGTRLGTQLHYLTAIGGALGISLYFGWQLTLVVMSLFPLIAVGALLQMNLAAGVSGSSAKAAEGAGKIAIQAIQNMRTVAALTKENEFLANFEATMDGLMGHYKRKAVGFSFLFGITNSVIFFCVCVIFAFGAYLIEEDDLKTNGLYKIFACIVFCGTFMGQISAFGPDITSAKVACKRVFALLDRKTNIDVSSPLGLKLDKESFRSSIEFLDARFSYQTRSNVQVLRGLNFSVDPGETVALVGSSGCGKSTSIALLERFYDLDTGKVTVGNVAIEDLNVKWLRAQFGLVSQEPVLFDRSITENIAYGDNSREVKMEEIIKAARIANIHNFIEALPLGYDTHVGEKGTQLSGGQKQRIAIARALIKNPRILLLDEATSALDTESEKIVQEALDKARSGRTCITIAHRLSTIQDADKIVVIHLGKVVEQGTHAELMTMKDHYYRLQTVQNKTGLQV